VNSEMPISPLDRREFLKAGGALIIGLSLRDTLSGQEHSAAALRSVVAGPPDPKQIDTWIAMHADNTATVYIGFAELGQGASTALLQVAAEELDLEMSQVKTVGLDTHITPNQGGTYSSAAIARGGPQIRAAAAEARQALLQLAAKKLETPVEGLTVSKGVVSVSGNARLSVTYGELLGGKLFNLPFTGAPPVKAPEDYKIVGQPVLRNDIPDKVSGKYVYMQHVRLPEMLHGRVVRPRGQRAFGVGAKIASIDETSIRAIAGSRVVRRGDFLGVVAENEWDAIRAARDLKVSWEPVATLPGNEGLFAQMRAAQTEDRVILERGNVAEAFASAAHVVSQTCRGPYQAHAPFGPNCAIADVRAESALVICSTQDAYNLRVVVARLLAQPVEKVRVQYFEGSGTYGHSCHDDAAQAAALLSQAVGRPVRLQFMRWDEHGWDNYGPAHIGEARAAVDAGGRIIGYEYHGWQHNWSNVETSAELSGTPAAERGGSPAQQVSPLNLGSMYEVSNLKLVNHHIPAIGYLKSGWLRSPLDLSFSCASEQAIDQLAYLLGLDPCAFRQNNIKDARWLGVLNAAAQAAGWSPRRAAASPSKAKIVKGRGIAVGTHLASYGGAVAEIEVNRETGKVVAKHLYGAIDAGLAVNPRNIENQIRGQLVQTASRMLKEEVKFNRSNVTSLDWNGYPILRFDECPEVTPVVVQRLHERSSGAGEEVMAAAAAAIANAFFDATGVRMQEYPLTPGRVLAALTRG
jgi:nicotinate dehydrogenase subunit B